MTKIQLKEHDCWIFDSLEECVSSLFLQAYKVGVITAIGVKGYIEYANGEIEIVFPLPGRTERRKVSALGNSLIIHTDKRDFVISGDEFYVLSERDDLEQFHNTTESLQENGLKSQ